jgi:cysteine desulfurase
MKKEAERMKLYRDKLIDGILDRIDNSYLNGHPKERLAHNANLRFDFIEGESLILSLKDEKIAAATGSACTSKTLEPSHTLISCGLLHEEAHGSLLFTLGRFTKEEDINKVLRVLPEIVRKLRLLSPLTPPELIKKYKEEVQ